MFWEKKIRKNILVFHSTKRKEFCFVCVFVEWIFFCKTTQPKEYAKFVLSMTCCVCVCVYLSAGVNSLFDGFFLSLNFFFCAINSKQRFFYSFFSHNHFFSFFYFFHWILFFFGTFHKWWWTTSLTALLLSLSLSPFRYKHSFCTVVFHA